MAAGTSHAVAQDGACEARGTNGMVTVVLCPAGLDKAAWQEAGKSACGDRKPCGAWLWDDAANLPVDIPDSHDKLPGDSVRSALAIWINEQDRLMVIEKQ
ncbi:hypothetical protein ACFMPD_06275 [Sedimentitalea sp. HM32M-2]|uniref:hypothetical protein n=1 Tax=Sedimentitalea sp. HM32M-2 TaxID=3351566 RepID=UPI003627226D